MCTTNALSFFVITQFLVKFFIAFCTLAVIPIHLFSTLNHTLMQNQQSTHHRQSTSLETLDFCSHVVSWTHFDCPSISSVWYLQVLIQLLQFVLPAFLCTVMINGFVQTTGNYVFFYTSEITHCNHCIVPEAVLPCSNTEPGALFVSFALLPQVLMQQSPLINSI